MRTANYVFSVISIVLGFALIFFVLTQTTNWNIGFAIGIVLAAFGFGAMAMLAFLAPEKPYWAVPLPIALMGLGLVLYYRLSVAADASDTTTRHGG